MIGDTWRLRRKLERLRVPAAEYRHPDPTVEGGILQECLEQVERAIEVHEALGDEHDELQQLTRAALRLQRQDLLEQMSRLADQGWGG